MKILLTGGSSFTGHWFIKELVAAGHDVVATFRHRPDGYPEDPRRRRVLAAVDICRPAFEVAFGDDRFVQLINEGGFDLLCHHGADVTNYKSADFDVAAALSNNTRRLPAVLETLANAECTKVVLTGSVFENDEGVGSVDLQAFSPYGLSKGFTWQMFRYHCQKRQMTLGKFVIPNPFGPFEEPRFTHYLMTCWLNGETAIVNTPDYVRDNIHVSLLAKCYVNFVENLAVGISRTHPSGYIESQGTFTQRVSSEMRRRLGVPCEYELKTQAEFHEPRVRINTDQHVAKRLNWSEVAAWDDFANYYAELAI